MVEEKPNAKTKGNKSKSPTARVNKEPNVSVSVPGDVKREPIFPADTDLLKPPPDKITIKTKESNSSKAAKVKKEVESFGRSEVTPTDVKVEEEEEEEEESPIGKDARPKAVPISVRVKDEEVRSSLGNAKEEIINVTTKKKKNKGQDDGKDKKHRKVYELPGQKHDPPEERDPLRIFYETLYEQRPTSEMAEFCKSMKGQMMNSDEDVMIISESTSPLKGSPMTTSYKKTRSSLRIANKFRQPNMEEVYQERQSNMDEVCQKRRKMGPGRCKPYFDQIRVLTRELNSKIEIQKKLKASYEKSLQNVKEILSSVSFLRKSASKDVDHCRTHIEQIKAAVRQRGSACTDKLVGEFCVDFWQSGTEDEKKVNELLTMEKSAIFEFIMKARLEYEAYQKRLEENEMIEQACKRNMEEKTTDLEKIEGQIIGVNSVIAELQSALAIQEKYRRKLGNLRVSKKMELGGCSLYPRPVSHPILGAKSVETHDTQIVINVSPCPVCSLAFERETMDIIVASCGHTFHPFCLVCDGNLLNKCPKCLCQMTEMWLKSFGVVEEGTSISHSHSWQKTTEKFNASSREMEKHQPAATAECTMEISATAECTMESSAKSDSTGSRNIKDNCCHDAATAECTMESSATAECTMESSAKSGRQLIYYRRHYRRPYYRRNIKD